ncbi:diacylglycerol O-acyltransferase 1 [Anoplophora glabripennis]|uniref:diacylglycerol O-acyltransferase 1 n=1 Tax=Anoplophora glabripennis TaxID=217634 RepID=UPI000874C896|nr:diacylglycerol O-acyltransferase 1 [Anoplophora glabripennis]
MSEQDGIRKRAQSVTRAEEIQAVEQKARKNQPDKPCHKPRDSLFSWNSGFDNFTGFVNWGFLLLSIGGIRLLLENFIKYGIRVDPIQWFYILTGQDESGSEHPSIVLILYSVVPVVLCLLTEKGLAVEIIPTAPGMLIHIINLLVLILLPMVIIHIKDGFSLVGASCVTTLYSLLFLKLWSYVQVNMWCRVARLNQKGSLRRQSLSYSNLNQSIKNSNDLKNTNEDAHKSKESYVQYPDNLTLRDLYYFLCAPTLCYELNFPRTDRIRKRFLVKRIFEVLAGMQIILCVIQQWMIPSVKNSLIPFSNMDFMKASERLLKLAIPNHLAWLCMFYIMFHSWLNLLGEILHFADRSFYNDWWNANNIDVFWRNWNLPVHRWALRHLYLPMVEMGYSKYSAGVTVFFISAFFHEYMVSVPLKTYKIWAFMGMMGQIPLSHISRYVERRYGPRFGNLVVWSSIIIGQPLCIMMYYHDYIVIHYGESLLEDYSHV